MKRSSVSKNVFIDMMTTHPLFWGVPRLILGLSSSFLIEISARIEAGNSSDDKYLQVENEALPTH